MAQRLRWRRRGDEGASLVEFALILPIFMCLVLGMITGGVLYNRQLQITHAVREGARYGATVPTDETFSSGTWATNVRDVVVNRSDGQLTSSQVCVALVAGTTATPVTSAHTTNGGNRCFGDTSTDAERVQVSASRPGELQAFFFTRTVTLSARSTAAHESDG